MADGSNIIKMRGLPWSSTEEDIRNFLENAARSITRIVITLNREGRPNGEAYVEFSNAADCRLAQTKHNSEIGKRYIEIYPARRSDMENSAAHHSANNSDRIVRLRGLPYGSTRDDVEQFFSGLSIASNGVLFVFDDQGRQSGECFVRFTTPEHYEAALKKHKDLIGTRYIEVFRSSYNEASRVTGGYEPAAAAADYSVYGAYPSAMRARMMGGSRFSPYSSYNNAAVGRGGRVGGRGGGGGGTFGGRGRGYGGYNSAGGYDGGYGPMGDFDRMMGGEYSDGRVGKHIVHVRGLPYDCGQQDLVQLFRPLRIASINFVFNESGRPSGDANVEFYTYQDALAAMKRDRASVGSRYVELYLNSYPANDQMGMPYQQPNPYQMGGFSADYRSGYF